jgi:uncharacterized coiled-coil DUF342 family protein
MKKIILASTLSIAAITFAVSVASAQTAPAAGRIQNAQNRADNQIDVRVESLTKLQTRLEQIRNISDSQKSTIVSMIQNLITSLNILKTKIASDTSTTTLKEDTQAITQNYRVYALAIPQLNILAASDRIVTISVMMNSVAGKLDARLAQASGISNLTALQASLAEMKAKIADAATLAQTAVNGVSQLAPDQGDRTKMESNLAAMKDARKKLQQAHADLVTARKDAQKLVEAIVKYEKSTQAGSTTKNASSSNPNASSSKAR